MRFGYILGLLGAVICAVEPALADGEVAAAASDYSKFAPALAIAIAAAAGATAQGRVLSAAVDSMARNPGVQGRIFTTQIVGLVLIESLVIYALVIAFMLL